MNILQMMDADGNPFGLYLCNSDKDMQPIIDKCEKQVEIEQNKEDGEFEGEDEFTIFEELLRMEGITRTFADEVCTKLI